jgi:hypothetical protein
MTFSDPAWLWLLLLPVVFLLMQALRRRPRSRLISSQELWRETPSLTLPHRGLEAPPITLSLLLGLLILVCLAFAASGPWIVRRAPARALAVVVDASRSMAAPTGSGGQRRIEAARAAALARLRAEPATPVRLLVVAGAEIGIFAARPGEDRELAEALDELMTPGTLERAEAPNPLDVLARAAANVVRAHGGGQVVVVSDFCGPAASFELPAEEDGVAFEAVNAGTPAANVAVTSLVVARHPGPDRAMEAAATVRNASPTPASVTLVARAPREQASGGLTSRPLAERRVLPAGETALWRIALAPGTQGLIEVQVLPGGALAEDDRREAIVPGPVDLEVAQAAALDPALGATIESLAAFGVIAPGHATVTLLRGSLPNPPPRRFILLASGPPPETRLPRPAVALDFIDRHAPFLEAADPVYVDAAAFPPPPMPPGAVPVALVAGKPAVAVIDEADRRGIWWGIPLEGSNLAEEGRLPLVFAAMLRWLNEGPDPSRTATSSSETISDETDLVPRPPEGARAAEIVAKEPPAGSWPLRRPLLWLALVLVAAEGVRRALSGAAARGPSWARGARDSVTEPEPVLPAAGAAR